MDVLLNRGYAHTHPNTLPKVLVYIVPNKALAKSIQNGYWFTSAAPERPIETFVFNDIGPETEPALEHEVVMVCQAAVMTPRFQNWIAMHHSRVSRFVWDEFMTLVTDCGWRSDILDLRIGYPIQHVFLSGSAPQSLMPKIIEQPPFVNLVGAPVVLQSTNRTVGIARALVAVCGVREV
jgi:hypothetical protein